MNSRKPEMHYLIDNMGFFTSRCPTKEIALKLFREEVSKDPEADIAPESITLDQIEETRKYYHRACETYTMSVGECHECMLPCGTNGTKTFVFYTI